MRPGGLGRFIPCSFGANHCRLRHIVWEKVVMFSLLGLEKVPLSLSSMSFLVSFVILQRLGVLCLLALFPSVTALIVLLVGFLLGGYLFPVVFVVDLVTASVDDGQGFFPAAGRREVFGVRNSGLGRKRIRLNRKPLHTVRV